MTRLVLLSLLAACSRDPNAPPELHYDKEACDHCGMLISDPAHAAALTTPKGETLGFDDPGCLFSYMMKHPEKYTHMWFSDGSRWYTEAEVGFSTGATTPMGSGLQAVSKATPGAISIGEASSRVVGR